MKAVEIRELPTEDIDREIAERRRALFNLRFQRETEQVERPSELRRVKREIARLMTIRRERDRADRAESVAAEGRSEKE